MVSRDQLIAAVWPDTVVEESNLTVQALENLNSIMGSFAGKYHDDIEYIISSLTDEEKKLLVSRFMSETRKKITTQDEINVIEQISEEYRLTEKEEKDDQEKTQTIEFF